LFTIHFNMPPSGSAPASPLGVFGSAVPVHSRTLR
jgi:hypothetical protein